MREWLAVRRWRLVWCAVGVGVIRIGAAGALRLVGDAEALPQSARVVVPTALDAALIILGVVVIVAFVQYGRIYRARVPTE